MHIYIKSVTWRRAYKTDRIRASIISFICQSEDENMDDDVQNGTQEQQRVNANNWRANIAATMWTDAMHMGS